MANKKFQFRTIVFTVLTALGIATLSGAAVAADTGQVVCRVETDRAVLPAGDAQNVVLKITLDAPLAPAEAKRPRVNIALVMDQSGSMSGTKMQMAREAAIEALTRLGKDDVFSLVTYDTDVTTLVPAQQVRDVNAIVRQIRQIRAGGSTALFGGVSQGASEIRKHIEERYIHRVVLLSDGLANVGPSHPSDLGRLGAGLFKESISVTTIGVGTDYNEDLMARLSQRSDGNTYFAEAGMDLPRIFAAELGEVLNVVAKEVRVIVTLPDDVTPVEIIGREGRIKGNRIELSMNQLYGGQEKYALIEVRLPPAASGTTLNVARAEVAYQDPFAGTPMRSTGIAKASFSRDPEKVSASTNVGVVRDYQRNLNALAQEKAIELSDQGRPKEAAATLRQSAAKMKAVGSMYGDAQLAKEAEVVEDQAEILEEKGMSKKTRKKLRTESYQMKNQQMAQ